MISELLFSPLKIACDFQLKDFQKKPELKVAFFFDLDNSLL
ncbi:hypothetical protein LP43_1412 [Methylophaga thiooxydans]|uniref:Uncharacterized protein n=1 Tax=Methylophaga thiooxydans TaxID=392484 RepID=A0A0A0BGU6_9GAMM|nr:hypothetical protein LP43_1412 [Methylophaga thiooxydans]